MKKILMALMLCLVSIGCFGQQPCPGEPYAFTTAGYIPTVKIGNQCWMRENLRVTVDNSSNPIQNSNFRINNDVGYYEYSISKQLCPDGWRIPTTSDFVQLQSNVIIDTNLCPIGENFVYSLGNFSTQNTTNNSSNLSLQTCGYYYPSGTTWELQLYRYSCKLWLYDGSVEIRTNTTPILPRYSDSNSTTNNYMCNIRCIKDTTYVPELPIYDTVYITDTITLIDTNLVPDTITIHDTIFVTDTLWLHDTITVTDTIYVYIDTTNTGIHEWGKTIKAYPNPTTGQLYLEGDFRQVSVWDMNGKCLQVTDEKILNFETLSGGVYILRIITVEGNVVVKKIIKQ